MQQHLPSSYLLQNRYRITRKIGQGGFGITYEAIDQELEKKVCIKELYIEGINQRSGEQVTLTETKKEFSWTYFIGNFKREAQKIAEFRHSNIVSVSSVFEANGTAYYVMEYVEGENLKEYLNRLGRPFTEEEIKPIAAQIFDAVDTVHSKGLLHRDIKPDNFLINADNQIVLIDFGSSRENMDEKTVALLSSTTILMLTHGYSAPEMYSNLSVKGRYTDIYSLGATLYYLLCQKKPMPANDRQFAKMPALHEVNPAISTQLSSAVMMAMEMKEEDRFQSVGDFRLALQQMAGGQKKKEEQKTVVIPKTESTKTVQNPENGKKNNKVLIFSLIGGVALILLLLKMFNFDGGAHRADVLEKLVTEWSLDKQNNEISEVDKTIEFESNGDFSLKQDNKLIEGTYKLSSDGNKITIVIENSEEIWTIKRLYEYELEISLEVKGVEKFYSFRKKS
jgi:serine/threonine protein kinase